MKDKAMHLQSYKGSLPAMSRVYVGNLDDRVSDQELKDEFQIYKVIRRIWVARKPWAMPLLTLITVKILKM